MIDLNERWKAACINELIRHGGNKHDLDLLRQQLRKAENNKAADEDNSRHAGDIPR